MPLATATNIIAALLIGLFLVVPHAASAQGLDEATALNQQVIQLYNQGRYSEAIPLAQRTLAIVEKALGPNHPDVALALNNLANLYSKLRVAMPTRKPCTSGRWQSGKRFSVPTIRMWHFL